MFAVSGGPGAGGAGSAADGRPRVWAVWLLSWVPAWLWRVKGPGHILQQHFSLQTAVESIVQVQCGQGCGASPPSSGCENEVLLNNRNSFFFFLTTTLCQALG